MGTPQGQCLQRIAQALQEAFAKPGQIVARYRGAEFVVLLYGTGAEDAKPIADHLYNAIDALDFGHLIAIGVATAYPKEGTSRAALLTSAKNAVPNLK